MKRKLYVADRHGNQIEEVSTIEDGIKLIHAYVDEDEKEFGDGDLGFYEIEDDEYRTVWYMGTNFTDEL